MLEFITYTGWLYKVSPDGAFEKGTYQPIASLYLIVGFIILIVINFKKYRNCEAEDIVRMILLFSLETIAILLQVLEAEMFQDGFIGSALLIILYYDFVIEIESKYDKLANGAPTLIINRILTESAKRAPTCCFCLIQTV